MLIKELIQRVLSLYSKGVHSDDSRLTHRHIYNKLLTVRAKLVSLEAKKKRKINQWNYQTLPCVELIKVPIHECPCLPPVGCEILRTKYKIPKPITGVSNHLIQSVTSLDGSVIYKETLWDKKKYQKGNKYTQFAPDYFIRNEYLYITYKNGPKIIQITGIFNDPLQATDFPSYCPSTPCVTGNCEDCKSFLDKDFPIENDMIEDLITISVEELVILFSKTTEDLTNNTQDNNPEQSK